MQHAAAELAEELPVVWCRWWR